MKALAYDREQYKKGYVDAMKNAVPLDKLCRMLAKYIGPPCNYSPIDEEMADYCGDQCEMEDIGCWEKVISKWMEGLDAADKR